MKKLTVIIDRVIGTVRSAIYDPVNKYSAEVDSGRALKVAGTVSGTIPLPTGAATEATLSALNTKVTACDTGAVTVAASVLPTGAATEATLSTLNGKVTACNTGAIAGTVTANAGTNLNTSALALEAGGNLAAAATSVSSIDGKITACNTGAVVVSSGTVAVSNHPTEFPLPAGQLVTLTPPAAITGFSTETTLSAINGKLAAGFEVNEIKNASATITYIGAETAAGVWWIRKMDSTSGSAIGHATEANNPTYTTYANAWTNRATLTYGNYSGAF